MIDGHLFFSLECAGLGEGTGDGAAALGVSRILLVSVPGKHSSASRMQWAPEGTGILRKARSGVWITLWDAGGSLESSPYQHRDLL